MTRFYKYDSTYMTDNLHIALIAKQLECTRHKPANLQDLIHPVYTITSENDQIGIVHYNSQTGEWIRISNGRCYPISSRKTNGQDVIIDGSITNFFEFKWRDEFIKYVYENNPDDGLFIHKSQIIELEHLFQKLFEDERAVENTEELMIPCDCLRKNPAPSKNIGEGTKTDTSEISSENAPYKDDSEDAKNGSSEESGDEDERQ